MTNDSKPYGPNNPHPLSQLRTELVWEGKYDEYGRRRQVSLPTFPLAMQRIETIDEPCDRSKAQGTLFEPATAHRDDFRNRLIWGDNKLAMAALLQEFRGQIKLIYIDPPYNVDANFSMDVSFGDGKESLFKEPSALEFVAYTDTWGKDIDSYVHVMYERLLLMRDLLAEDGSIYVHLDWRVNAQVKLILHEIFGSTDDYCRGEIVWKSAPGHSDSARYGVAHNTILFFQRAKRSPGIKYGSLIQKSI